MDVVLAASAHAILIKASDWGPHEQKRNSYSTRDVKTSWCHGKGRTTCSLTLNEWCSSLEKNVNKGFRFPPTRKLPRRGFSPPAKSGQHTIHLGSAQPPVVGHVKGSEDGDEEVPGLDLVVGVHDGCSLPPPPLLPQLQRLQPVRPEASACLDWRFVPIQQQQRSNELGQQQQADINNTSPNRGYSTGS